MQLAILILDLGHNHIVARPVHRIGTFGDMLWLYCLADHVFIFPPFVLDEFLGLI